MLPETALVVFLAIHSASRAEALVARLGSPSFSAREAAARELIRLGNSAVPAMRRGQASKDPEVGDRCTHLLPLAEAEGLRQRIASLERVCKTSPHCPIPSTERLLRRFVAVAGDTPAARQLYFDIYSEHRKFLDEIEWADPKPAGETFWGYVDRVLMYPDGRTLVDLSSMTFSRVDLALFWFLSADPEVRPGPCKALERADCPYYFPKHASGYLDGPKSTPEMRHLFRNWLVGPRNVPDPAAHRRMVATGLELARLSRLSGFASSVHEIALDRTRERSARVEALFMIMQAGDARDVDRLAPAIADDTIVYLPSPTQGGIGRKVRLGDVALAACVRLTGRQLSEFGFPDARDAEDEPAEVRHYGFSSDEARAVARRKWMAWSVARALIPGGKP